MNNLICIGKIISAHGIKGEAKFKSFASSFLDKKLQVFDNQENLIDVTVRSQIDNIKNLYIIKIKNCNNRNDAEALKGQSLYIKKDSLPQITEKNEYYINDLVGLEVVDNCSKKVIGKVINVFNFGAGDIIEIVFLDNTKNLFSFKDEIFPEVNLEDKKISFIPPEYI